MRIYLVLTIFLLIFSGCFREVNPLVIKEPASVHREQLPSGVIKTVMIAHRGGANLGPENTCGAVIQSSFYRPDFYEVDIRHTRDGVAVCLHDEDLERTTEESAEISQVLYDEISDVDAGSWVSSTWKGELIPTFERMVDCVNPSGLAIELKEADITVERCTSMLDYLNERSDISSVVMSFHRSALETWREAEILTPRKFPTRTIWLTVDFEEFALTGDHDVVGILKDNCTSEIVDEIHRAEKAVWVWTVNENFRKYVDMAVDGIVTDSPDRLREFLPPA